MTTSISLQKRLLLAAVLFGGVVLATVASAAWACTAFIGTFEITGDVTGAGTVTATGKDHFEKNNLGATTFGMNQTIEGATEATSGASGGIAGAGWIQVATSPTDDGVKLPASSDAHFTRSEVGPYHVNFVNGPAYLTHDQWTLDCMSYLVERTTGLIKLGEVQVGNNGKISHRLVGDSWEAVSQPVQFDLPDSTVANDGVGESAACISDVGGWVGNQAPINML